MQNENSIKISVTTNPIPKEMTPNDGRNYFEYHITITNVGDTWAKLLTRHWIIIDGDGNSEEVKGDGVVGYFPELSPGSSFSYTSYCPLDTNWGTMEGTYQFTRRDGTLFDVAIPRFVLYNDIE